MIFYLFLVGCIILVGFQSSVVGTDYQDANDYLKEIPASNGDLTPRMGAMENRMEYITDRMTSMETKMDEIIGMIKEQEKDARNLCCSNQLASFVGFTAFPTEDRGYNNDDVVIFDWIVSNYGGHYHADVEAGESYFLCPAKGYYLFSVYIRVTVDLMHLGISLDKNLLVGIYSGTPDGNHSNGGNSVVILCDLDQRVEVICKVDGGSITYGHAVTFSGTLLELFSE